MLKEFRAFITRGNVIDLAVAVIIGAAFGQITTSLVNQVIMPPLGLLIGGVDFSNLGFILTDADQYATVADAVAAGAPVIQIGAFLNTLINFLIIAIVIFLLVRQINRIKSAPPPVTPTTKDCPFCLTVVPIKATRCPACTSDLSGAKPASRASR
jgi:large conductance mechanosensitive channel